MTQSVHLERVRRVRTDGGLLPVDTTEEEALLSDSVGPGGPVIYWMSRDQRAVDNWALLFAREVASQKAVPLFVVFNLVPQFLEATERQFHFLLHGLAETEAALRAQNIPFYLLRGTPFNTVPLFTQMRNASALVTDFSPLRTPRDWVTKVAGRIGNVPMYQVDAHNVVPVWAASDKQEYAARTLRPKIRKLTNKFLVEFPPLEPNSPLLVDELPPETDWKAADRSLQIDRTLPPVDWLTPGTSAGMQLLSEFCASKLKKYRGVRNNPSVDGLSNLSPYFHFGQVAPQRAILAVNAAGTESKAMKDHAAKWVEEAFVFQELTDNYCFYQPQYDSLEGAPEWARKTLEAHKDDKRPYMYSLQQLDRAETHSPFWNAMQTQLVVEGKLHAWCRMQWAKGILEWTESPEEALRIAIFLNDRYNVDGRDPNGYVGCMWCIAGLHDRPFADRSIFGTIRYKNADADPARRRFNAAQYIEKYSNRPLIGTLPTLEKRRERPIHPKEEPSY